MSVWLFISVMVIISYALLMAWIAVGISKTNKLKENLILPSVSIIVSLRNESQNVETLVTGLKSLQYPKSRLEIILVNDNSTDSTYQDLLKYQSSEVTILNNNDEGKKKAIEMAVKASNNDWIAVTDADCVVPELWIDSMVKSISETTKMVLGPVFISETKGFLSAFQSIEFLGLQGATAGSSSMGNPVSANAANMMFRKDVFEELKPYADNYDYKTGDDQFLLMAVSDRYSNSVVYSKREESIVLTQPVVSWNHYISQRIRWASKGNAFTQFAPKLVGLIVFFASLVLMINLFISFFYNIWNIFIILFIVKLVSDLLVVVPMKKFSNSKVNFIHYWVSTLLYPFVVLGSVIGGLLKKEETF